MSSGVRSSAPLPQPACACCRRRARQRARMSPPSGSVICRLGRAPPLLLLLLVVPAAAAACGLPRRPPNCSASGPACRPAAPAAAAAAAAPSLGAAAPSGWRSDRRWLYLSAKLLPCCCTGCPCPCVSCCRRARHSARMSPAWPGGAGKPPARQVVVLLPTAALLCRMVATGAVGALATAARLPAAGAVPTAAWRIKAG